MGKATIKVAVLVVGCCSLTLAFGGCKACLSAYPEMSYDPQKELKALDVYLRPDALSKYDSNAPAARNGMSKREWRNEVVNSRIRAMDIRFGEFQQALFREGVGLGIATDWIVLGLTGAGALFGGASQELSAGAAGVVGAKASFDKHAFFDKTMPTLLATMVSKRKQVLVEIRRGLAKDIDEYPLTMALIDLDRYYQVGSIPGALLEVAEAAGETAKKADAELERVLVVSAVPEDLQLRREKAAAFIKSLQPEQLMRLAKSLGLQSAGDPLDALLSEIASAETNGKFDRVAQNIRILFGKEF